MLKCRPSVIIILSNTFGICCRISVCGREQEWVFSHTPSMWMCPFALAEGFSSAVCTPILALLTRHRDMMQPSGQRPISSATSLDITPRICATHCIGVSAIWKARLVWWEQEWNGEEVPALCSNHQNALVPQDLTQVFSEDIFYSEQAPIHITVLSCWMLLVKPLHLWNFLLLLNGHLLVFRYI